MKYMIIICLALTACHDKAQLVSRPLNKYLDTVIYSIAADTLRVKNVNPPPQVDSALYYLRKISTQLDNLNRQQRRNSGRSTDTLQSFDAISVTEFDTAVVRKRYNPTRIINKAQQQISRFSDSLFRQWTFEQNLRYN